MTPEDQAQVLIWFKDGQSLNHIVFLLKYKYRSDVVSLIVRKRLIELEALLSVQRLNTPSPTPYSVCSDCGGTETEREREYCLDCRCGGRWKSK